MLTDEEVMVPSGIHQAAWVKLASTTLLARGWLSPEADDDDGMSNWWELRQLRLGWLLKLCRGFDAEYGHFAPRAEWISEADARVFCERHAHEVTPAGMEAFGILDLTQDDDQEAAPSSPEPCLQIDIRAASGERVPADKPPVEVDKPTIGTGDAGDDQVVPLTLERLAELISQKQRWVNMVQALVKSDKPMRTNVWGESAGYTGSTIRKDTVKLQRLGLAAKSEAGFSPTPVCREVVSKVQMVRK